MPIYVAASGSNSILDQLIHLKAQGIYQSGGVPDSAMEQSYLHSKLLHVSKYQFAHIQGTNTLIFSNRALFTVYLSCMMQRYPSFLQVIVYQNAGGRSERTPGQAKMASLN